MKIALPMNNKDIELKPSDVFGRATYFLILDTKNNHQHFLENEAKHDTGGAGVKAAQALVDEHIDVLIAPQCGKNAAEVLTEAGTKLYKTKPGSALENILWFKNNLLRPLEKFHSGYHGESH